MFVVVMQEQRRVEIECGHRVKNVENPPYLLGNSQDLRRHQPDWAWYGLLKAMLATEYRGLAWVDGYSRIIRVKGTIERTRPW